VTLPDSVDTTRLAQLALQSGMAINPGAEWMTDAGAGQTRLRLCFAHPKEQIIREGVARLAEVCHREFAIPARVAKGHRYRILFTVDTKNAGSIYRPGFHPVHLVNPVPLSLALHDWTG
jgi:hypothetical protein